MTRRDRLPWFRLLPRNGAGAPGQPPIVEALRTALVTNDRERLERLLHLRVTLLIDGGGAVTAPKGPVRGRARAAHALLDLFEVPLDGATIVLGSVNGAPSLVCRRGPHVVGIVAIKVRGARVDGIWVVVNPAKLRHWNSS